MRTWKVITIDQYGTRKPMEISADSLEIKDGALVFYKNNGSVRDIISQVIPAGEYSIVTLNEDEAEPLPEDIAEEEEQ